MNKSMAEHYFKLAANQGHATARPRYEEVIAELDHS
jgi:hypothetical protein